MSGTIPTYLQPSRIFRWRQALAESPFCWSLYKELLLYIQDAVRLFNLIDTSEILVCNSTPSRRCALFLEGEMRLCRVRWIVVFRYPVAISPSKCCNFCCRKWRHIGCSLKPVTAGKQGNRSHPCIFYAAVPVLRTFLIEQPLLHAIGSFRVRPNLWKASISIQWTSMERRRSCYQETVCLPSTFHFVRLCSRLHQPVRMLDAIFSFRCDASE